MRAVIRLFNETFGLRYYFLVLVLMFAIILVLNGSNFELSDIINPVNVGFLTIPVMIGFGSNKGIITLARLLPTNPGTVACGLQISLYLSAFTIHLTNLFLGVLVKHLLLTELTVYEIIGHLVLNTAFVIIIANIMLSVMLWKGLKPLKIAVVCLMLPMPFIAGETADVMTGRLAGTGMFLNVCLILYAVVLVACVLCHIMLRNAIKVHCG